ncbi:MAG: HemK family protein methyltransferase [Patescibacteria group bacterium]
MDNIPKEYKKDYINFAGCKINLSMKPLIPRKETEFWIKKTMQDVGSAGIVGDVNVLDVFAGSGCIGISILKHIENSKVDFIEIDKNLIKQIQLNLKLNKINPRKYKVIQSDIFRSFKDRILGTRYNYIFANPPYVSIKNKHLIQKSVLDYEPHLALFGGEDGLLYIRKFLKDARKYLKPGGKIYMEFDCLQKMDLEKLLKELNYPNYKIYKDQFKKYRYICIQN